MMMPKKRQSVSQPTITAICTREYRYTHKCVVRSTHFTYMYIGAHKQTVQIHLASERMDEPANKNATKEIVLFIESD